MFPSQVYRGESQPDIYNPDDNGKYDLWPLCPSSSQEHMTVQLFIQYYNQIFHLKYWITQNIFCLIFILSLVL